MNRKKLDASAGKIALRVTRGMTALLVFAFGVLCTNAASAATPDPLGPLRGAEKSQLKDGWSYGQDGPWFMLKNQDAKQTEQTLLLERGAAGRAGRYVSATVAVDSKEPSASIGLVARNTGSGDLCLMEVTAAANANLFCVVGGKNVAIASKPKAAQGGGKDFVQMVETGDGADFFLNGQKLGSVGPDTLQIDQVGVMAYDTGLFGITDFKAMTLAEAKKEIDSKTSGGDKPAGNEKQAGNKKPAGDPPGVVLNAMEQRFDGVGPIPQFDGTVVRRVGAYLGITSSIFTHEFGHALINELDLPSTGPEEDAVDIFSALHLVDPTIYKAEDEDIDAIGRETAVYGALQWYYSGKLAEAKGRGDTPWQDEHTADLKRYRNFLCVIYGGNPKVFGQVAEATGLDERTLGRCTQEYTKQNRAWRTILAPYTRVGPWHPEGTRAANTPGAKVTVKFEPSKYRVGNFIREAFAEGMKTNADDFSKTYVLPRPLTVVYRDCDELNAWYSHDDATITMCYDLLANLVSMVSDVEMKTVDGWTTGRDASPSKGGGAAPSNAPPQSSGAPAQPSGSFDETQDFGMPAGLVLYPAPYRGPTPTSNKLALVVKTADLAAVLKKSDGILLIDTSKGDKTIPGAIQVADVGRDGSLADGLQDQVVEFLNSQTKGDKKQPIVFFGTGLNDRSSYNAALRAGQGGFKAFWYRGGIEAWLAAGLPLNPVGK
jgi:rhodanese-related sulfurtransferase